MSLNDHVDFVRLVHFHEKQNRRIVIYEITIALLGLGNLALWILAMKG